MHCRIFCISCLKQQLFLKGISGAGKREESTGFACEGCMAELVYIVLRQVCTGPKYESLQSW